MYDAPPTSAAAVRFDAVAFSWRGRAPFHLAVPDLAVARGEKLLLLGESGSGKSTLLSLICGVITPDRGRLTGCDVELGSLRGVRRDRFRAETIGVIFQMFNLLPYATPLDNILLPLRFARARRRRVARPKEEALRLAAALALPAGLVTDAAAADLSVGQQQRVAVARALIGAPPLIVADEPTSALDASTQSAFLDVLFRQVDEAGATLLMVSHDQRLASRFDRAVDMASIAKVSRAAAP